MDTQIQIISGELRRNWQLKEFGELARGQGQSHTKTTSQICLIVSGTDSTYSGMFVYLAGPGTVLGRRSSSSLIFLSASELELWSFLHPGAAAAPLLLSKSAAYQAEISALLTSVFH